MDDTCRGMAQPVFVSGLNQYEVFLMVYGNKRSMETVNFLIYDQDKEQVSTVNSTLPYINNRLTGDIDEPYEFKVLDVTAPELNAYFLFSINKL